MLGQAARIARDVSRAGAAARRSRRRAAGRSTTVAASMPRDAVARRHRVRGPHQPRTRSTAAGRPPSRSNPPRPQGTRRGRRATAARRNHRPSGHRDAASGPSRAHAPSPSSPKPDATINWKARCTSSVFGRSAGGTSCRPSDHRVGVAVREPRENARGFGSRTRSPRCRPAGCRRSQRRVRVRLPLTLHRSELHRLTLGDDARREIADERLGPARATSRATSPTTSARRW